MWFKKFHTRAKPPLCQWGPALFSLGTRYKARRPWPLGIISHLLAVAASISSATSSKMDLSSPPSYSSSLNTLWTYSDTTTKHTLIQKVCEMARPNQLRTFNTNLHRRQTRARVNKCLNELKSLIAKHLQPESFARLTNADVLELAVTHLNKLQSRN